MAGALTNHESQAAVQTRAGRDRMGPERFGSVAQRRANPRRDDELPIVHRGDRGRDRPRAWRHVLAARTGRWTRTLSVAPHACGTRAATGLGLLHAAAPPPAPSPAKRSPRGGLTSGPDTAGPSANPGNCSIHETPAVSVARRPSAVECGLLEVPCGRLYNFQCAGSDRGRAAGEVSGRDGGVDKDGRASTPLTRPLTIGHTCLCDTASLPACPGTTLCSSVCALAGLYVIQAVSSTSLASTAGALSWVILHNHR